jgi:hypothetical protein
MQMDWYNALPSVEDADCARRETPGFDTFLNDFADMASRFGLGDAVGASLLHRHFWLTEGENVLESAAWIDGRRALVARVVGSPSPATSCSWRVNSSGELVPLEYSDDAAVQRAAPLSAEFVTTYAKCLRAYGIADLVGLRFLHRDSLPLGAGEEYLEETVGERSVTTAVTAAADSDTVTTVWALDQTMGCAPSTGCRGWSTCRRSGSPPDDRHSFSYGHDQERRHNHF